MKLRRAARHSPVTVQKRQRRSDDGFKYRVGRALRGRTTTADMDDHEADGVEPPVAKPARELPVDSLGVGAGYATVRARSSLVPRRRRRRQPEPIAHPALPTLALTAPASPHPRLIAGEHAARDPSHEPRARAAAGAGDEPTMSALSPTRPAATHADAPVSPSQAAAAAAAAVASAAAAAAAEVTRRSLEAARAEDRTEDPVETNLDLSKSVDIAASTSEFLPPGTPVRDAFERAPAEPAANAADAPTTDAVAIAAEPSQKADASTSSLPHFSKEASTDPGPEANTTAVADVQTTEPSEPSPASAAQTHFLRKDGGNQPEVMNSIAGLFGPAEMEADEDSRDRAFEEALERVRQSRRDIADKAAKGFSDMKAYYEAELREAKAHGLSAAPAEIPVSSVAASVAAAAAAAEAADAGGARRGGTAWDLDERALAASLPVPSDVSADETRADAKTSPRDSVWPEAWRGSYSPPKEPAPPPFPLSQAWSEPPGDRAPENPPEVRYPHDAAKAAEALAASVAAAQRLAEATGGGSPRASAEAARVRRSSERARGEAAAGADANPDPDASPEALARRAKRLEENLAAAERREQTAERAATDAERKAESLAAELRDAKAKLQRARRGGSRAWEGDRGAQGGRRRGEGRTRGDEPETLGGERGGGADDGGGDGTGTQARGAGEIRRRARRRARRREARKHRAQIQTESRGG